MGQQFLASLTLQNGLVLHGIFSPIMPADLPDSGVVPGGYTAPSLILDRAGRVLSASNATSPPIALTNFANVFTVGPQTINSDTAGHVGLVVNTAASPTADIQDWDINGTKVSFIDSGGNYCTLRGGSATNLVAGQAAGASLASGSGNNVLLGYFAGNAITTGISNVVIGNTAIGLTTGNYNFCLGDQAGYNLTTGGANVAIGQNALHNQTTTNNSVAIGSNALATNATAGAIIGIGNGAGQNYNGVGAVVFIGSGAGVNLSDGIYCTVIGWQAFQGAVHNNHCTVIGAVGLNTSTADDNTGIGYNTGATLTSGANNTLIGSQTDTQAGTTHDGISLGYKAACVSNELAIAPAVSQQTWYTLDSTNTLVATHMLVRVVHSNTHGATQYGFQLRAFDTLGRTCFSGSGTGSAAALCFYGGTDVVQPSAYSGLDATLSRSVPGEFPGGTGIDNTQVGTVYAQVNDLNTLGSTVNNLIQVVSQMLKDLGAAAGNGLLGTQ